MKTNNEAKNDVIFYILSDKSDYNNISLLESGQSCYTLILVILNIFLYYPICDIFCDLI